MATKKKNTAKNTKQPAGAEKETPVYVPGYIDYLETSKIPPEVMRSTEPAQHPEKVFPFTEQTDAGGQIGFETEAERDAWREAEKGKELFDLKARYAGIKTLQGAKFTEKAKYLFRDILNEYKNQIEDKYFQLLNNELKDWESQPPERIRKTIDDIFQQVQSEPAPQTIKPLADKIQWKRDQDPDTEKLKAHIEGLEKAGFITFTNINKVMSGEEMPRTVKHGSGVRTSESRNIVYIFAIWYNLGYIENFVSPVAKLCVDEFIIKTFRQSTGKLFNQNSLSKRNRVITKIDKIELKDQELGRLISDILK